MTAAAAAQAGFVPGDGSRGKLRKLPDLIVTIGDADQDGRPPGQESVPLPDGAVLRRAVCQYRPGQTAIPVLVLPRHPPRALLAFQAAALVLARALQGRDPGDPHAVSATPIQAAARSKIIGAVLESCQRIVRPLPGSAASLAELAWANALVVLPRPTPAAGAAVSLPAGTCVSVLELI